MNWQELEMPAHHRLVINRFVAVCQADERVVAATLYGSYARGAADAHSDLDLGLITTDEAYQDFCASREAFIRRLGEPLFLEDFGSTVAVFFILSNGAECELSLGRESQFNHEHSGPYQVLVDKKNILAGAGFPRTLPAQAEQVEMLRSQVYWFWHDLSHFITALGRGQLWWAAGQLEVLRRICVNLARLHHNFSDPDVGEDPYFKVEQALPVGQLSPLQATFCPQESRAMLQAALVLLQFFQELAPLLARTHGITYPAALDQMMADRLKQLKESLDG
jgi:predicted nucleotidyltransferase